jgi:hypothetical protein
VTRHQIPHDEWQYRDRTSAEVRGTLLRLTLEFVLAARQIPGVVRIAMLGSLATAKSRPKDADVLVTIAADGALEAVAQAGRRFQGRAQGINSTADVFLADTSGRYLGRICHFRECRPRVRCLARHCGARPHLADDLDVVSLDDTLIVTPPFVLHPTVRAPLNVPPDVGTLLLEPLRMAAPVSGLRAS